MLSHYFKMALVVLWRRKFMAFVNIFGIVITLLTLIVGVAALNSGLNPKKAARNTEQYLVIDEMCFTGERNTRNGGVGHQFYTRHLQPMQTPDKISFSTSAHSAVVFQQGQKLNFAIRRTDATYWEIMQHQLLEGRWYDQAELENGQFVAVINESLREQYFAGESPLNQSLRINGQTFNVIGVVEDEPETSRTSFSDIWVPLTTAPSANYQKEWIGDGQVLVWIEDASKRDLMARETQDLASQFEYVPDPTRYEQALFLAKTPLDNVSNKFLGENCTNLSHASTFISVIAAITLVFMLLPAINMINLNVSRILERAPEIGLRKAAGASNRLLVGQFLVETLVVTTIGGVVAFVIAPWVLAFMNNTLIRYGQLSMSLGVFMAGLGLILVFGLLSGVYPAWRMSKLAPANALRGGHRHA
ncbi:FtsX-like permease family protein [Alteromonadaceae bacterium M269]|nr:FtsX-like permease family protein [Alteromonadaceae bacterium M269]